jgi:hypothetical protein
MPLMKTIAKKSVMVALLVFMASVETGLGQEHDWRGDADNDASLLVSRDIENGTTRSQMALLLAMGSFLQHHSDYTRDETVNYAKLFLPFYMQQLKLQGEPLAGPLPDQEAGTNRLSRDMESEVKSQLKLASFDVTGAESATVKHEGRWYWGVKYKIESGSESDSPHSSDVYIFFKDRKLFRAVEDQGDAKTDSKGDNKKSGAEEQQRIADGLKVEHLSGRRQSGFLTVRGEVTNTGNVAVKFIQVEIDYLDPGGNVIDQGSGYVDSGAFVLPGKTGAFTGAVLDKEQKISSWRARIIPSFQTE